MTGVVIVGAGECGTRAAFALREQGFTGRIVLVGEEPVLPYERPPLSKQFLLTVTEPGPKYIASAEAYRSADIELRLGQRVLRLERDNQQVLLQDDDGRTQTLAYDQLLLATGATPRPLPLEGVAGNPRCLYLRTVQDATRIRSQVASAKHLLIIGAGLIGLELAASARHRGVAVTVLEAAPRILGRAVPALFAEQLAARHQAEGVALHCGVSIVRLRTDEQGVQVQLQDGQVFAADFLVIGIGAIANTELAEQAGLAVQNGIVVNEYLQTSDPAIFAAGDCCAFPVPQGASGNMRLETWRNAQEQGNFVARSLLGTAEPWRNVVWFWSDQYDLTLQVAGLSAPDHQLVQRELGDGALLQFELDQDGYLVAAAGLGVGNKVAKDIRLAEMLIAARRKPAQALLADAGVNLKQLLR